MAKINRYFSLFFLFWLRGEGLWPVKIFSHILTSQSLGWTKTGDPPIKKNLTTSRQYFSAYSCYHFFFKLIFIIWAASSEFGTYRLCEQ